MPRKEKRKDGSITQRLLLETFDIDSSSPSGLVWKKNRFKKIIGQPAGSLFSKSKNYGPLWIVPVLGRNQYAHRMIWIMVNGVIPEDMVIDHLNGIPSDNRIENLSLKTTGHNTRARQKKHCRNTSGYHGVSWRKDMGKWCAQIQRGWKCKRLGFYDNIVDAARAVDSAMLDWASQNNEEVRLLNFKN